MNIFRLCGDFCHALSIIILLRRLITARNAQGISLRSEELRFLVFATRYTDLFTNYYSLYNSVMKMVYLSSSLGIIYAICYKRPICETYDKEQDTFPHVKFAIVPCGVLALLTYVLGGWHQFNPDSYYLQELLWMFSIYLEAVAILPQLVLLRRYRIVENLTGNYIMLRGLYRFLYIINWVYRAYYEPGYQHRYIVYACGVLQTALYIEFFYYWVISKKERRELSYGEEGDTEYYDCDVNELRNAENAAPLIDNNNLRMRVTVDAPDEEDVENNQQQDETTELPE